MGLGLSTALTALAAVAGTRDQGWERRVQAAVALAGWDRAPLDGLRDELAHTEDPDAQAARAKLFDRVMRLSGGLLALEAGLRIRQIHLILEFDPPPTFSSWLWDSALSAHLSEEQYGAALDASRHELEAIDAATWKAEHDEKMARGRWAASTSNLEVRLGLVDRAMRRMPVLEEARASRPVVADPDTSQPSAADLFVWSATVRAMAQIEVARERWSAVAARLQRELDLGSLHPDHVAQAWYWLGQSLYELAPDDQGQVARARAAIEKALTKSPAVLLRAQALLRLGRIALDRGELSAARSSLDAARAVEEADRKGSIPPLDRAHRAVFEARLARREGDAEAAEAALLERWRELLAAWHAAPPRPGGVGYLTTKNPQRVLGEVLGILGRRAGPEAAWRELVDAQRSATLVKRLAPDSLDGPVELPTPLADEALWAILPTLDATHLFVATRESVWYATCGALAPSELERKIAVASELVRTPPDSPFAPRERRAGIDEIGEELFRALFPGELGDAVQAKPRLTVVGAELVRHLPIEVLAPPGGPPLGLTHDVAYCPTLALHGRLGARTAPAHVLDLRLVGGGADLVLPDAWSRAVASEYPPARAQTWLNGEAQVERLAGTGARVLQVVGHGRFDHDDPEDRVAAIELVDGRVDYRALVALPSPPDLALLSACGSWRSAWRPGDGGVAQLASATFEAGARCAVSPAADIGVDATLAWSQVFHWALTAGLSPAAAAREARCALAESAAFGDPFHHSLLHVIGDGHRPVFEAPLHRHQERPDPALLRAPGPGWRQVAAACGALLLAVAVVRVWLNRRRDRAAGPAEDRNHLRRSRRSRSSPR